MAETDTWNVTGWTNVNGQKMITTALVARIRKQCKKFMQRLRRSRSSDFTLSVDSLDEDDGGTVSEITRKGMLAYRRGRTSKQARTSFYRDSDITITAVPNAGYRVQDPGPSTVRPRRIPQ